MRLLIISLVLVVLVATIGLGRLFDNLFIALDQPVPDQTWLLEKKLTRRLALLLESNPQRHELVQSWQVEDDIALYSPIMSLTTKAVFPLPVELEKPFTEGETLLLESDKSISIHQYIATHEEVLTLHFSVEPDGTQQDNLKILLTLTFYTALLCLIMIWVYPLVQRLLRLRQTAKAFGQGQLNKRVEVGSTSYIADIEIEFNNMARRIETLVNDIKLMSGAVSHELRTPLARIRFGVETLAEVACPNKRESFQKRIINDVDNMVELVECLLNFARLEQNLTSLEKSPINLTALVEKCLNTKPIQPRRIEFTPSKSIAWIKGESTFVEVLISNLLQNAFLYSHSLIHVSIEHMGGTWRLIVEDDGPGVPEEKREQIIQPFIRGQQQTDVKGFGMGLAIVTRICDWHRGRLCIEQSDKLNGARFTVTLPQIS